MYVCIICTGRPRHMREYVPTPPLSQTHTDTHTLMEDLLGALRRIFSGFRSQWMTRNLRRNRNDKSSWTATRLIRPSDSPWRYICNINVDIYVFIRCVYIYNTRLVRPSDSPWRYIYNIYAYIYIYIYAYICIYMYKYMYVYMYHVLCVCVCVCVCVGVYVYMCMYRYIYIHIHTHTHINTWNLLFLMNSYRLMHRSSKVMHMWFRK